MKLTSGSFCLEVERFAIAADHPDLRAEAEPNGQEPLVVRQSHVCQGQRRARRTRHECRVSDLESPSILPRCCGSRHARRAGVELAAGAGRRGEAEDRRSAARWPAFAPTARWGAARSSACATARSSTSRAIRIAPSAEGTLCPKGSATFQLAVNPNRLTKVKYRAPYATEWEEKDLDWAMDRIAERVKETRDGRFPRVLGNSATPRGNLSRSGSTTAPRSPRSAGPRWITSGITSSSSCGGRSV